MNLLTVISVFILYYTAISIGDPSVRFPQEVDYRPWKDSNKIINYAESSPRLSGVIIPTYYRLYLRVILDTDPGRFTAPGNVTITVEARETTDQITLNARALDIDSETITVVNTATGLQIPVANTSSSLIDFTFTIILGESLVASQEYKVFIQFTAPIPVSPLTGLYRSSYVDPETNQVRYLAATQLENDHARKVFPSFDEPSFKAIFEISLGRTKDKHSLCNMRIISSTQDPDHPDFEWDHYEPTVKMPTYLLAIVVSDFISETAPPELFWGKLSKVWAAPYKLTPGVGMYSAETSAKVITYFEDHYQTTYDLPKLDSGAIPDFSAGAMENWGLVLYRENLLLYYNGTTTEQSRRSISSVISHELAHQWFGNIVTMRWWNDIWLNEGIATYASYWGVNATDPEYDPFIWIVTDAYQSAMAYDVGINSQPVSNDGSTPSAIIYDKGASIIRMMEGFLSESTLTEGIHNYLQRHSYGNAIQDDLFQSLTEQAVEDGTLDPELTVKLIMDTWTHQTGFPLIRVNATGPNEITLSQESFGPNSRKVNTTVLNPDELWYVPISYHNEADPDYGSRNQLPKLWISKNVTTATLQVDTTKWLFINTASTGYFRVLYDDNLRLLLREQLETDASGISPASRSQTIDDYFKFAFAQQPYALVEHAMDFTTYLGQENRLDPWISFFNNFGSGFDYFSGSTRHYSIFRDYFAERVNSALNLIGVEQPEEYRQGNKVILRARLLQWGCAFGLSDCYDYANKLRLQWVASPLVNPVPVDIRSTMYCAIVAAGGESAYNFVLGKFFEDTTAWRNALGCAADLNVIGQVLELSLNSQSGISKDEAAGLLQRVAMTPEGRPSLREFLQTRITDIIAYHDAQAIASAISTLSNYLSDPDDYESIQNYIFDNQEYLTGQQASLNNSLGNINRNINWMAQYGESIVGFLTAQNDMRN